MSKTKMGKVGGSRHIVDWVSFTIHKDRLGDDLQHISITDKNGEIISDKEIIRAYLVLSRAVSWARGILPDVPRAIGKGRRGSKVSLRMTQDKPQYVFVWDVGEHILFEITGQGCEKLRAENKLKNLLWAAEETCTRIDVANDLETQTDPVTFATERGNKRFKSGGEQFSESGHTVYVGSQKSPLMARVYRYYEPHPRARFLRVEYVARADEAKNVILAINDNGVDMVSHSLAARFQWLHPDFQHTVATPLQSAPRSETGHAKTVRWLSCAVRPAIRRLIKQEILTLEELTSLLGLENYRA